MRLEDADVDALLAEVPAIGAASPETLRREVVARRERVFRAAIVGVRPAYGALRSMRPAAGGRILSDFDGVWTDQADEARAIQRHYAHDAAPRIASALVQKGFALTRLEEEQVNLETAFMRLTKGLVQ